jgi:hypothetical protein
MRFWQRLRYVEGEREAEAVLLGAANKPLQPTSGGEVTVE